MGELCLDNAYQMTMPHPNIRNYASIISLYIHQLDLYTPWSVSAGQQTLCQLQRLPGMMCRDMAEELAHFDLQKEKELKQVLCWSTLLLSYKTKFFCKLR